MSEKTRIHKTFETCKSASRSCDIAEELLCLYGVEKTPPGVMSMSLVVWVGKGVESLHMKG